MNSRLGFPHSLSWLVAVRSADAAYEGQSYNIFYQISTSVSSKRLNSDLFTDQVLQEIIQHIVVKNLTARESDEELEDNPTDFIRKDMEGSDRTHA